MATAANPPLYLHVTSQSKSGLERAVQKIEELMKQELPNLVDERRFRRREPDAVERDEFGRRKWPEERIAIDFEPIQGFNLRAQVVGHQGAYVKHIQQETRCRVQIKGRGSGFMEQSTGQESDEDMYLHVAGPDPKEVQHAKELCEDLLANVRQQYEEFKARGPQNRYASTGYGGQSGYGDRQGGGGYGNRDRQSYGDRSNSYGGGDRNNNGYGGYNSPAPNAAASMDPGATSNSPAPAMDAATQAQYAAYYAANPDQDPYAAYGGYAAYAQYYQQYMAAYAAQGGAPPASNGAAPPPPPADNSPPPPPPGGASTYGSVPPPPGL